MNRITLLTQPNCGMCEGAKQVLARIAHDVALTVEEIDLGTNTGHRLAADAGVLFAPGLLLNGQPFGYGRLSERKLRKALAPSPHTENQTV